LIHRLAAALDPSSLHEPQAINDAHCQEVVEPDVDLTRLPILRHFPFDAGPFYVNTELAPWQPEGPRRAGVSSFGVGGTNAHAILEEPPEPAPSEPDHSWQCLVLSAATEAAADRACERLADWLKEHPEAPLADVAHTLAVGRKAFPHRRAVACRDAEDAAAVLAALPPGRIVREHHGGTAPSLVFLFPGQGAQHPGMARDLYEGYEAFRAEIDRGAELLREALDLDLRDLLYPEAGKEEEAAERLAETRFAQPALFLVEHALAGVWKSRGLEPEALVGHSVGELVAACIAGVFTWEDALHLVAERGRLMQAMPRGAMLSVPLPLDELTPRLGDDLVPAAHNAPGQVVVSGPEAAIEILRRELGEEGVEVRRLHTSHAFHSPTMEPAIKSFAEAVARVERSAPRLPVYSNVSGEPLGAEEAMDPEYWGRQLRRPVRFREAIDALGEDRLFLEVGPGQTLGTLLRQWPQERRVVESLPHPKDSTPDAAVLAGALGRLWAAGLDIHWRAVHQGRARRLLRLPTYPFERRRHWVDPGPEVESGPKDLADWFYLPRWRQAAPAGLEERESAATDDPQTWLLFHDPMGLTAHLAPALEATGQRVVTVVPGAGFEELTEHHFALDPGRREDLGALFRALSEADLLPHRIVHGGALLPHTTSDDEELRAGFYSLLALGQALGERGAGRKVRLDVLSRGLFRILGNEELVPVRAALLGPLRVMPQEIPGVTTRLHELAAPPEDLPGLAQEVLEELLRERPEDVLAYRGAARFTLGWQAQRLPAPGESPWPTERAVLVTGGVEDPGLAFVEELARRGVPGLLLLGDAPPEAESAASRRLAALEGSGLVLRVVPCDLWDEAAVAGALTDFEAQGPPVGAVLHAAERGAPGLMMLKEPEQAAAVLAPKVAGTQALLRALGDRDLDFFVSFGATSAITGALGQADGCAANSVLDAIAHEGASFPCLTLDWPVWRLGTEGTGNAAIDAWVRGVQEQYGLEPAEGFRALEHALAALRRLAPGALPQVLVSRHDFETLLRQQQGADASSMLSQLGGGETRDRDRSADDPSYVAPRSETEERIVALWQEMFGFEPIGVEDEFFQLGGHSLLAVQMVSRLRDDLGLDLNLAEFLESPTVAAIAERVAGHEEEAEEFDDLLSEIENLSPEEIAARLASLGGEDDG
jgi:acyl transferase domain-containing protein